jgi:hypothetical protein
MTEMWVKVGAALGLGVAAIYIVNWIMSQNAAAMRPPIRYVDPNVGMYGKVY